MAIPVKDRSRHDGAITFAAEFTSLFIAGGATRLSSKEPESFVSTLLFFVLVLAYGLLTTPGRRAAPRHFILGAIGVPALFIFLLIGLDGVSPQAVDLLFVGGRVGLPMWWGGPDADVLIVGVIWGVSVTVPLLVAALARSFLLPSVEEFMDRRAR